MSIFSANRDNDVIVIWSTAADTTADLVERHVGELTSDVIRVDTDRYGDRYSISWSDNEAVLRSDSGAIVRASEVSSVYYRRPTVSEVARTERDFALHEVWYFTRAALLQAEKARWMNHPCAVLESENKLRQLQLASKLGFLVPEGILTSCPAEAFTFYERMGRRCVCKPGYAGVVRDRELTVYAWRVPVDLGSDEFSSVAASPTFLQQEVQKRADIRLTYVGGDVYAARVLTDTNKTLDWRSEIGGNINYEPVSVPPEIRSRIGSMMRSLHLSFGAFDFAESQDGGWHFLEVNPAGQFEWIEYEAGLGISAGIAQWLAST